jgi:hypothetical protein
MLSTVQGLADLAAERTLLFAEVAEERAKGLADIAKKRTKLELEIAAMHTHQEKQEGRVVLNVGTVAFLLS